MLDWYHLLFSIIRVSVMRISYGVTGTGVGMGI